MSAGPDRVVSRLATQLARGGVIVAVVLLLVGCRGTSIGADGADGAPGIDDAGGIHVIDDGKGGDGGTGNPGGDGGDAVNGRDGADGTDGRDGADGPDGRDGADGLPGLGYSDGNSVTGSGELTSRQFSVTGVTTLDVGGSFVVQVTIGQPEQATIRVDDNLAGLVEATVTGDRLRLGLKPGANVRNATLSADVTVASLDRLTTSGVSEVRFGSDVVGEQLQVDASGASRVAGPVSVDQVLASASGASTIALSGDVGHLDLSGSGTSGLRLPHLSVRDLDVVLTGSSCATVAVRDTLAARASGVSALRYSGTPRITRQETSGVSSIAAHALHGDPCGAQPDR